MSSAKHLTAIPVSFRVLAIALTICAIGWSLYHDPGNFFQPLALLALAGMFAHGHPAVKWFALIGLGIKAGELIVSLGILQGVGSLQRDVIVQTLFWIPLWCALAVIAFANGTANRRADAEREEHQESS